MRSILRTVYSYNNQKHIFWNQQYKGADLASHEPAKATCHHASHTHTTTESSLTSATPHQKPNFSNQQYKGADLASLEQMVDWQCGQTDVATTSKAASHTHTTAIRQTARETRALAYHACIQPQYTHLYSAILAMRGSSYILLQSEHWQTRTFLPHTLLFLSYSWFI